MILKIRFCADYYSAKEKPNESWHCYYFEYYCYAHKVSDDMFFGHLQVFSVEVWSLELNSLTSPPGG